MEALQDSEIVSRLLVRLRDMFGEAAVTHPTPFIIMRFGADKFLKGGLTFWPVRSHGPRSTFRAEAPVLERRMFFAGEYASLYMGTVDAAFLSGTATALRLQCHLGERPAQLEHLPGLQAVLKNDCVERLQENHTLLESLRRGQLSKLGVAHVPQESSTSSGRCSASLWDVIEACSLHNELQAS